MAEVPLKARRYDIRGGLNAGLVLRVRPWLSRGRAAQVTTLERISAADSVVFELVKIKRQRIDEKGASDIADHIPRNFDGQMEDQAIGIIGEKWHLLHTRNRN